MSPATLPVPIYLSAFHHCCSRSIMYEQSMGGSDLHKSHNASNYLLILTAWNMDEPRWQRQGNSLLHQNAKVALQIAVWYFRMMPLMLFVPDKCCLRSHIHKVPKQNSSILKGVIMDPDQRYKSSLVRRMGRMWSELTLGVKLAVGFTSGGNL